ncbi:MAG: tetratricopeptide repeat protein [Elusimicrobiota bacterium]|nr:tetratricopeptide repeat protein [Elusimicrobiota bacterium]
MEKTRGDGALVVAGLLTLAALAAYLPVLLGGGFIWDDDLQVVGNLLLRSPGGLADIWTKVGPGAGGTPQYYPLSFSAFWLQYQLWGLEPRAYHLVNVLLHALDAFLLWRVLRRLELPGAGWAAALFAVHPVNAESVAWVIELKNVLSAAFYLAALDALLRYAGIGPGVPERRRDFAAAFALFALALAAKTSTVVLPGTFLVLLWWKRGSLEARDWRTAAPLFALAAAAGAVTTFVETGSVGASGAEWSLSWGERAVVAGRALWFYAGKLAWPAGLTLIYPRWDPSAGGAAAWLWPASALALPAALWAARERLGRGPTAAALIFGGSLLPVLGFVNVYFMRYSFVADHFQYLAAPALLAAFAAGVARLPAPAARAVGAALVLVLGGLTARRGAAYAGAAASWADNLRTNPGSWLAHNNLGAILNDEGRAAEALAHFVETTRLNPAYAEGWNNLGLALLRLGRPAEAEPPLLEALRLRPGFADANHNLGAALAARGRHAEAVARYEAAVAAAPGMAQAWSNLGASLAALGRHDDALARYREAVRRDPALPEAHFNLGLALARRGERALAAERFEEALRLRPAYDEARRSLELARRGR